MSSKGSGESLKDYCNRLIESNIEEDKLWGEQLLSEWDTIKNSQIGISIDTINKGSRIKTHWICENGHNFVKSVVSRTGKDSKHRDKCRECAYKIRAAKTRERALNKHTLRDWCNENAFGKVILKEFDLDKNKEIGVTLDNIPPFSETELFWICNKGHSYKALLTNRTNNMTGCPICKGNCTSYFEQLLYFIFKAIYPDTISRFKIKYEGRLIEFDIVIPELNIYIEYGTEYTHPNEIESTIKRDYCVKNNIDLIYVHSVQKSTENWSKELIIFKQKWHDTEEDAKNIIEFILKTRNINIEPLHKIDYDEIELLAYEYSHGVIDLKDSLKYNNEDLCKEWNNSKNKFGPEEYKKYSNKRVWWICSKCGHEWKASILNRNYNKSGCPKCAGRD